MFEEFIVCLTHKIHIVINSSLEIDTIQFFVNFQKSFRKNLFFFVLSISLFVKYREDIDLLSHVSIPVNYTFLQLQEEQGLLKLDHDNQSDENLANHMPLVQTLKLPKSYVEDYKT